MRRNATALAVLSVLALSACGGGGSVLSTGGDTPERVILTVAASSNVPRVLAGSGIAISAQAVRGAGNGVISTNRFTWSAAIAASGNYPVNAGGGTKPCAEVTSGTAPAGPFTTYTPDYSIFITIDPSNEANVIFQPPLTVPVTAGTYLGPAGANAYCAVVTATAVDGGAAGSLTVAVVNPQSPLQ